jgi:ribosomal protein L31E
MNKIINKEQPFCKFVEQVYKQPVLWDSLEAVCSDMNLNKNIILFCCWYPLHGGKQLSKKDIRDIITAVIPWHNKITLALDKIKHKISSKTESSNVDKLQQVVQDKLLVANEYEQIIITNCLNKMIGERGIEKKVADAEKNINTYFRELSIVIGDQKNEVIQNLLAAVFSKSI